MPGSFGLVPRAVSKKAGVVLFVCLCVCFCVWLFVCLFLCLVCLFVCLCCWLVGFGARVQFVFVDGILFCCM